MKYILLLGVVSFAKFTQTETLRVRIHSLKSNKGKVYLQVQTPDKKTITQAIVPINASPVIWQANLPKGRYAVRIFHDENNNGKLDTNFLGIPKESWGTSNNVKAIMAPPDFKKMLFDFPTTDLIDIEVEN